MDDLITFEHYGKTYTMTKDQIEAAYRYQQKRYLIEDAERQLNIFIFGTECPDEDNKMRGQEKEFFENQYRITIEDARKETEEFVRRFENRFDCEIDENAQWDAAIRAVLEDKM